MNTIRSISIITLVIVLNSCASLYMPNVPNTPMLSAKDEVHASGHLTLKGNFSFNSAYAFSEHWGVLLNASVTNQERARKEFKQNLLESGIGYFTKIGTEQNRILEIYAGLGTGNSERTYLTNTSSGLIVDETQEINFGKKFLQVNYSTKKKKTLNLFGARFPLNYGTALRISHIRSNKFQINGLEQLPEDNIFFEPVFFTRMAVSKNLQLQYSSGSNFGLKNRKYLQAGNGVLSIGLVWNMGGNNVLRVD
ncbi:hypothetical protein [Daejeonella sp.]|uniref:hypothetical protein n=1 Tax=Daejeonella sp. TaxID=2805397 RepID=UPI0027310058|nr:hypothetical protein [Daejeonella sp.]MDP2412672.1 hypothetical protein [Daejeonella sp.]